MIHGSLFSGIGGFDLAAEWAGWTNAFHCEWADFPRKVLKHYWPNSESYGDIKETDFSKWRGIVDVVSGGFPCQPYSMAGKRLGKEDDRHLWPEMLRAIREIQPSWVVGENVRGFLNWSGGLVFDEVQADLEAAGYEVIPFLLPACGIGAPHRRDRIWFVAYSESNRNRGGLQRMASENESQREPKEHGQNDLQPGNDGQISVIANANSNGHELRGFREDRPTESESPCIKEERERLWTNDRGTGEQGHAADTSNERLQGRQFNGTLDTQRQDRREQSPRPVTEFHQVGNWQNFPTQSPVCSGDDGLPAELDGITFSKWRNESIKAYGNAIVPQVAFQIFKAIEELSHNRTT